MNSRILITGISGYIGQYLTLSAPSEVYLYGTSRNVTSINISPAIKKRPDIQQLNLEHNPEQQLDKLEIDIIIHAAALASLSECENNPSLAFQINSQGTERIARWAASRNIRFVYISTDIVFSGENPPYEEKNSPDPVNIYGESKAGGEYGAQKYLTDYAIVRIALTLGRGLGQSQNFTDWLIKSLNDNKQISLFNDEFRTPISVISLAECIWKIALSNETGIFHLCGMESIDRYSLGAKICDSLGYSKDNIRPVSLSTMTDYPRPVDVSLLSTRKLNDQPLTIEGISSKIPQILMKND